MTNFFDEFGKLLNIPASEIATGFKIFMLNNACYIEGHRGIKTFSDYEICFKIKGGQVLIFGDKLKIKNLDQNTALITGVPKKIEREDF